MLVLERRNGEKIIINGNITLTVKIVENGRVKIAFEAPEHVTIDREEIHAKRILNPNYSKGD